MLSALGWGVVALVGVLWPSRLAGPLDGIPLDTIAETLVAGLVLPLAWILRPHVFGTRGMRALAASLAAWKLGTWLLLTQQGLCATFGVSTGTADHHVLGRSWDFRTAVTGPLPQCSAVLTRSLEGRAEFPAWFLNLAVGRDRSLDTGLPRSVERPAAPAVRMQATGYVLSGSELRPVAVDAEFTGEAWRFEMPLARRWLGGDTATITPPSALDRAVRHLWFVSPLLTLGLIGTWARLALARWRLAPSHYLAIAALTAITSAAGAAGETSARAAVLVLPAVLLVPAARRLCNVRSVVLFMGIPLLGMVAAMSASEVGRFTIYSAGDDWQTFQRHAARIYFEGFWLEGGERTFWQQPMYRWLVGLLHVIFGDSSVGERYWDGFGLIAAAALAYVLVRRSASHQWALAAGAATLVTTLLGPAWYLVGRGLSEISATLWLALAAIALGRARRGRLGAAAAAGVLATLAVYTRLNHLPLVIALAVLLLPRSPVGAWVGGVALLRGLSARAAVLYGAIVGIGLLLFAARTWFYTGHFSVLHGTTRHFNSTGLGLATIADPVAWGHAIESVLMVVTVTDPPHFDPRSLLVLTGVAVAILGVLRAPLARDVPLAPAVLCLAAISSAFVARGLAYPGRFSVHLIPLAVAVSVLMAARVAGQLRTVRA